MRRFLLAFYRSLLSKFRKRQTFTIVTFLPAVARDSSSVSSGDAPLVAVEEDWEFEFADPHASIAVPQITCRLSTSGSGNAIGELFLQDHGALSKFTRGGMGVQVWDGKSTIANSAHSASAEEAGDSTDRLKVRDDEPHLRIDEGTSTTWETSGHRSYRQASEAAGITRLDGYNTRNSASNPRARFGNNQVRKLVLKESRWYSSKGLVRTSTAPMVVVEHAA